MTAHGVSARSDELAALSPESGQAVFTALAEACHCVAEQICIRSETDLPGLTDAFRDRTVIVLGGQALGAYGSYQPEKWRMEEHTVDEIHINVGVFAYADMDSRARAVEIVDTIGHELSHLYARATGIKDTSGRGNRYHNRAFAQIATMIGLRVQKSPRSYVGHITAGLTERGEQRLGDLVVDIERAMRLLPADQLVHSIVAAPSSALIAATALEAEPTSRKYVSAQCACRDGRGRPRTLRMARGWWLPGTVGCGLCQQLFVESPPTRTKSPRPHFASTHKRKE